MSFPFGMFAFSFSIVVSHVQRALSCNGAASCTLYWPEWLYGGIDKLMCDVRAPVNSLICIPLAAIGRKSQFNNAFSAREDECMLIQNKTFTNIEQTLFRGWCSIVQCERPHHEKIVCDIL